MTAVDRLGIQKTRIAETSPPTVGFGFNSPLGGAHALGPGPWSRAVVSILCRVRDLDYLDINGTAGQEDKRENSSLAEGRYGNMVTRDY